MKGRKLKICKNRRNNEIGTYKQTEIVIKTEKLEGQQTAQLKQTYYKTM